MTLADDGAAFDCVVSNACGSATSSGATLSVQQGANITQQPQDQSVCVGGSAVFTVSAGGAAPISYDWRRNGASLGAPSSPTLTLNGLTLADDGAAFDCIVSNACGSDTSAAALLTVGAGAGPVITQQPAPAAVCIGEPASFSVTVADAGVSYEWRKDGSPISGAPNAATYSIAAAGLADAGVYSVRVFTACGSTLSGGAPLRVPGVVGDLNNDARVDPADLGILLSAWESSAAGDLDGDGQSGPSDLGILLANWLRACP